MSQDAEHVGEFPPEIVGSVHGGSDAWEGASWAMNCWLETKTRRIADDYLNYTRVEKEKEKEKDRGVGRQGQDGVLDPVLGIWDLGSGRQ